MIPIFLMKYVILENYVTQSVAQKRSMIQGQCQDLVSQISQSGYIHGASSSAVDRQMKQLANLYNGRVIVVNSNFRIIRDTFGIDEDKYIISEEVLESFLGTDSSNYNQEKWISHNLLQAPQTLWGLVHLCWPLIFSLRILC